MGVIFHRPKYLSQLLIFCLVLEGMASLPLNRNIKDHFTKPRLRYKRQNDPRNQVIYVEL